VTQLLTGHFLPPVSDLLQGFMCVCVQVSCSVVSNCPLCEFCGRVYCDLLSIILIPQFCFFFLRHQTMDKVQKHNSFNTSCFEYLMSSSILITRFNNFCLYSDNFLSIRYTISSYSLK
jgi:hypothetical protein